VEREVGQDDLGLVEQEELQRGVVPQRPVRLAQPRGQQVLEGVRAVEALGQPAVEALELHLEDGGEQVLLAAGEGPVDRGPAAARLAGDVVEGGLGHAPAADAAERRVDQPGVGVELAVPGIGESGTSHLMKQ
jgi:hypothetical protein